MQSEFKEFVYQNDLRFRLDVRDNYLKEKQTMTQNKFPPGWDDERVQSVIAHYEQQTEDELSLKMRLLFKCVSPKIIMKDYCSVNF